MVYSLDEEAKKEAWREHYERLLNVEFLWNSEDLSEESPVEGPSEPITWALWASSQRWVPLEFRRPVRGKPSWRPKRANHLWDDHKGHQQNGIWQSSRTIRYCRWDAEARWGSWRSGVAWSHWRHHLGGMHSNWLAGKLHCQSVQGQRGCFE